jgi:hypothetical protein
MNGDTMEELGSDRRRMAELNRAHLSDDDVADEMGDWSVDE